MSRARIVRLVTALVVLASGTGAALGASVARVIGEDGVGDSYYPLDGNGGYDVRKYVIRDRMHIESGELTGNTAVHAVAEAELTSFNLDLLLHVDRVVVNGEDADWFGKPDHPHELRIEPEEVLPDGEPFTVRVWYHGRPGKLSYASEESWFANSHEVLAVNEPHIAPYWYAANDHPSDKARFDIRISVPTGRQAIANGALLSRVKGATWTTWRWVARDPMTTYLAFFAAGRFRLVHGSADGTPYVLAVSRQLSSATQARALGYLERTPAVLRFMEKRLGDYPFETTGGVVPSLSTGFALENQTRPVYPPNALLSNELLAHELAHQWFGDLVSVERWDDIWINEGFAQYMEQLWVGGVEAWLEDTYTSNGPNDPLWDLQLSDPGAGIGQLFAQAVYIRGAMTLAALRRVIGSEDFWNLLHTWLAEHAHGNASVDDFRTLAQTVSGQDLEAFFDAWLDATERPPNLPEYGLDF